MNMVMSTDTPIKHWPIIGQLIIVA